jgi:hypothetical protein
MRQQNLWDFVEKGMRAQRAVARATDPVTSWEAARSQKVEVVSLWQDFIMDLLGNYGPMTDEELWSGWLIAEGISPSGARTRRAELVAKGLVEDSGKRRLTASGRKSIVWRAV